MFESKNIAYMVIAGILLYVGNAYIETFVLVQDVNKDYMIKSPWMHKHDKETALKREYDIRSYVTAFHERYGYSDELEKRLKKELYDKYAKRYYGTIKSANSYTEILRDKPLRFFDISGKIDKSMSYTVFVIHKATVNESECRFSRWSLWGGHTKGQKRKEFTYTPEIDGDYHHILIPIHPFKSDDPCGYELYAVDLHIQTRYGTKSYYKVPLFTDSLEYADQYPAVGIYQTYMGDTNTKIDIECLSPGLYGQDFTPCIQKPLKRARAVVRHIPKREGEFVINFYNVDGRTLTEEQRVEIRNPSNHRRAIEGSSGNMIRL